MRRGQQWLLVLSLVAKIKTGNDSGTCSDVNGRLMDQLYVMVLWSAEEVGIWLDFTQFSRYLIVKRVIRKRQHMDEADLPSAVIISWYHLSLAFQVSV